MLCIAQTSVLILSMNSNPRHDDERMVKRTMCIIAAMGLFASTPRSHAQSVPSTTPSAVIDALKQLIGFKSDSMQMDDATGVLTCEGHVTASMDKISFKAGKLLYDPKAGTVEIAGTFSLKREGKSIIADDPATRAVIHLNDRSVKIIGHTRTTFSR